MGQMAIHFQRRSLTLPYMPFRLWVESTNYCNLNCVMCLNKSKDIEKRGYMSYPLFKKIIDESKSFVHSINLHHRGEAVLHEDLPKMVEYCKTNGIFTQLHTNATLLSREKSTQLIASGLDFISFSIDGYDRSSYEEIRVNACYEKTVENILGFLRIKAESRKKRPQAVIEVMNLFNQKKPKIHKEFYDSVKRYPVKWIIKAPHNWAGGIELQNKETDPAKESACTFPWYSLTVLWNGEVVTCPQDFFGRNIVGDLSRESLIEIWNNSKMEKYRTWMRDKRFSEIKPCASCDRIFRRKLFGIPRTHLKAFLKESL
jgi:radical SAM protein with 4Fe4S-binding SPASM domain